MSTKLLHISNLTINEKNRDEQKLGPWCSYLDFFNNPNDFLINTYFPHTKLQEYNNYCNPIIEDNIILVGKALNKYHNVNYSNKFWELMLINWMTCITNTMHYYYSQLKIIDSKNIKYKVEIDEKFIFNKLSDVMRFMGTQEYIHSMISFLIKYSDLKNISFKEQSLIKDKKYIENKKSYLKDFVWSILNKRYAKKLIYHISGLSHKDKIKLSFKKFDYAFSYKPTDIHYKNDISKRESFILEKSANSEFENLLLLFIEKNLPSTLLENFDLLTKQAKDYKNKKLLVASSGLYIDEQLIELAFAKEFNNAKIVQVQEAGNAMERDSASANFLYKPIDVYLTWGWKRHAGYDKIFEVVGSRLSDVKDSYSQKYDNILYFAKFPTMYGGLYDSVVLRNWEKHFNNRLNFVNKINSSKYADKLFVKLHHGSLKMFDEEELMANMNCKFTYYNNPDLNFTNTAILYLEYMSSAFYESMACNVPVIMCIDPEVDSPNEDLQYFIDKFKKVGVIYDNSIEAANKVIEIYDNKDEFWQSDAIQNLRREFLESYVKFSSNWIEDTFTKLDELVK